jgi:hypothetical protein
MLIYVLRWWPSWISDRHKKQKFVEILPMIIPRQLYMNVHWMVLYNLKVFCSDMKFKMAATTGLSLTLDPMGKMLQNASSLKPLGQLKPNCPGIIIFPLGSNVNLFPAVVAILDFRSA